MIDGWQDRLILAIDERRERDGLTDRGLSVKADLGANFVEQLRKGGRIPRVETLQKLAAFLDISLHYILFGQEITAEEEDLLLALRQLDEADKAIYLAALRGMNRRAASQSLSSAPPGQASETHQG